MGARTGTPTPAREHWQARTGKLELARTHDALAPVVEVLKLESAALGGERAMRVLPRVVVVGSGNIPICGRGHRALS